MNRASASITPGLLAPSNRSKTSDIFLTSFPITNHLYPKSGNADHGFHGLTRINTDYEES